MFVCLVVFNATFKNSSAISWRSVLLMEETGGPGENHRGKDQLCVWSSIKSSEMRLSGIERKNSWLSHRIPNHSSFWVRKKIDFSSFIKNPASTKDCLTKTESCWHSPKLSDIPKPSSKYKTILMAFYLQYLTISRKHLVNK